MVTPRQRDDEEDVDLAVGLVELPGEGDEGQKSPIRGVDSERRTVLVLDRPCIDHVVHPRLHEVVEGHARGAVIRGLRAGSSPSERFHDMGLYKNLLPVRYLYYSV